MTTRTDFAKYLTRFLSEYLPHQRNVSKNTIASYRDSFVQFINYMKDINGIPVERLLLKHLTRDNVINYLQWLHNTKKNTSATCKLKTCCNQVILFVSPIYSNR